MSKKDTSDTASDGWQQPRILPDDDPLVVLYAGIKGRLLFQGKNQFSCTKCSTLVTVSEKKAKKLRKMRKPNVKCKKCKKVQKARHRK